MPVNEEINIVCRLLMYGNSLPEVCQISLGDTILALEINI